MPEKRFQDVSELLEELFELKDRLLGRGVTKAALWEGSRRLWLKKKREEPYRERNILVETKSCKSEDFFREELIIRGNHILTGTGGLGKTSFLKHIWGEHVARYQPESPVVFYISLERYQEAGQEPYYIRKRILEHVTAGAQDQDTAMSRLEQLLCEDAGKVSWIFLLDGLNEAGTKRELLLREIEHLAKMPGMRLLLTDRTGEAGRYALFGFRQASLLPFSGKEVIAYLEERGIPLPEDTAFRELLGNPMIFSLYCNMALMKQERSVQEWQTDELPRTMNGIVGMFLTELVVKEQRIYAGDEVQQLRAAYAAEHLLPAIAGEMQKRRKTFLSLQELSALLERDYRQISSEAFAKAFPKYTGKSRKLFREIKDAREWLDCAVRDVLMGRMDLLEEEDDGGVRLIHDNFAGYLTEKNRENLKRIRRHSMRKRVKRGAALLTVLCMICIGGMLFLRNRIFPFTAEENRLVDNAFLCLMKNMRILDGQLSAQKKLLDDASKDNVLSGEELPCEQFVQTAEYELSNANASVKSAGGGEAYIDELYAESRNTIPLNTLQKLYEEPEKQQEVMAGLIAHLVEGICSDGYNTRTRKEELIAAYREYLEAYEKCIYLDYYKIILSVPKEKRQDIEKLMTETACFSEYMVRQEYVSISAEELETMLDAAENVLQYAKNGMLSQNYFVPDK